MSSEDTTGAVGYMITGPDRDGGIEADWDGVVHPTREAGEAELAKCQETYRDWFLCALVPVADLAGRVVVDLPEPVEYPDDFPFVSTWLAEGVYNDVSMHPPANGAPAVVHFGLESFAPGEARNLAAALLAAADAAERLSVPGSSGEVQGG